MNFSFYKLLLCSIALTFLGAPAAFAMKINCRPTDGSFVLIMKAKTVEGPFSISYFKGLNPIPSSFWSDVPRYLEEKEIRYQKHGLNVVLSRRKIPGNKNVRSTHKGTVNGIDVICVPYTMTLSDYAVRIDITAESYHYINPATGEISRY
jgi:hypothetical protein